MKAQASIEFALMFLLSLALISLMALSMLSYGAAANGKLAEISSLARAESAARASEVAYRCNLGMETRARVRIEEKLYSDAGGRLVEVEGVFVDDESEPV